MLMSLWREIVGYTCRFCGQWATRWYRDIPMCCTCHTGEKDAFMLRQAQIENTLFQKYPEQYMKESF